MNELIPKITNAIYSWLSQHNYFVSKDYINIILTIIFGTTLIRGIFKVVSWVVDIAQKYNAKKDLHPLIAKQDVNLATKFYIQTKGQNISPANESEPRNSQAFIAKEKLIPKFIKAIQDDNNPVKHYLILADSGMGKTTFFINFYLSYNRILLKRKYKIVFLPLAHPEIEKLITEVPNQQSSILLLDGFDEDPKSEHNYYERITFLTRKTYKFRRVFISSRTQFFPSEDLEPIETKLYKVSTNDETQHYFKKIYVSPFDDTDVIKYINKKFPYWNIWNIQKRKKAIEIIKLCPNLMIRPMLLSYIDDLVDRKSRDDLSRAEKTKIFLTSSDIYKILIDRWIQREANRIEISRRDEFIRNMHVFSSNLAIYMYQNKNNNLTISAEEIVQFANNNDIQLSALELKGKSLLNRDAVGNYKFSHKSILEYFLARHAIDNKTFGEGTLYFSKMKNFDQAEKFCTEMNLELGYN